MSSGSPSQTVHDVGGPPRGQPEQAVDGNAEQLALEVVERCVERALRRLLALDVAEPRADLLERERIVADEVAVVLDERERGLRGLAVALDRRRLAPPLDCPSCAIVTWTTSAQSGDSRLMTNVSASSSRTISARTSIAASLLGERRDVRDHVRRVLARRRCPAGITPRPGRRPTATSSAVSPLPASAGPTPPDASAP